jgi:putative oxidoreductase
MEWLTNPFLEFFDWDSVEYGLVPLRVVLGYIFFDAGLGKWRRGISGTGRWMDGLGVPFPQASARLVATVEVVGGLLLIVGLAVHWAAAPLSASMLVATYVQKFKIGAPFQGGDVQGYELDVLMLAGAITLMLGGAGPISLDAAMGQY